MARYSLVGQDLLIIGASTSQSFRHTTLGRTQKPLPDNTQHSQETDIHAPGGIRNYNPRKQVASGLSLGPRSHWHRQI
jgi:hypothetical protein